MKLNRISIIMLILCLAGLSLFTHALVNNEQRRTKQQILAKGNYLTSLIALYPIRDFSLERRDFFLRTLNEYTSPEGLVYFYVHDQQGQSLLSLAPDNLAARIPADIQSKSLYTMAFTQQQFHPQGFDHTIYEFAKPVFENGQKTGTVRLGLKLEPAVLFSMERVQLVGMVLFFVAAGLGLFYYGIINSLKPLSHLNQNLKRVCWDPEAVAGEEVPAVGITPVISNLEGSLGQVQDRLGRIEAQNTQMAARIGAVTFEKNQILNILDSIHFGIIIADHQNRVIHINGYMLKLLKRSRQEIIDRPAGETIENETLRTALAGMDDIGPSPTGKTVEAVYPELAPGEVFQALFSFLTDQDGLSIGKMIQIKNITGEKIAESAKGDFIASVSHELLTPLTNIKSYSELLMDDEVTDAEMQKEFYNIINEETNRLSHLVQNLLNISKMEMGNLTLNKGTVRTDWFVKDCIATVEGSAREKNITIEKDLPDIFPSIIADKELLRTAIINIMGNAVKYTPENGRIRFAIAEQDKTVLFEIEDSGYGISQEDLPHIFDKFFRSGDHHITEQKGSGLGLATTSEIVQLHEGAIDVHSQIGSGTRFTVRIPKEEYRIAES